MDDEQARMRAEYTPWERIEDIDVPVQGHPEISAVRVPWVCARDAQAVTKTAIVVAQGAMMAVLAAETLGEAAQARQDPRAALAAAKYEPPLVHFYCDGCEETWDAWVNDDGSLQDQRDVACGNSSCSKFTHAATLVDEEDV
jgi:hypothetical protein